MLRDFSIAMQPLSLLLFSRQIFPIKAAEQSSSLLAEKKIYNDGLYLSIKAIYVFFCSSGPRSFTFSYFLIERNRQCNIQ